MKLLVVSCAAVGVLGAASAAHSQVTQSYSYDANGRLTGVTTSGSWGTNSASYSYDRVHNRVQRVRSGSSTYAAIYSLPDGGMLSPSEALVSPDGRFTFAMRPTGELELWRGDDPVWKLEDLAHAPAFALTDAGALVALERESPSEAPLWSVTNEGALVATTGTGEATVWSSAAGMH